MQTKRTIFGNKGLPYLLLAPQLVITAVFFLWPAGQAVYTSFLREDAFGLSTNFVWFDNYERLFRNDEYLNAMQVTVVFSIATVVLSMGLALLLALAVDRMIKSAQSYTTLLIWPYGGGARGGGDLVVVHLQPHHRHPALRDGNPVRLPLEPFAEPPGRYDPGGDRRRLEADQL